MTERERFKLRTPSPAGSQGRTPARSFSEDRPHGGGGGQEKLGPSFRWDDEGGWTGVV